MSTSPEVKIRLSLDGAQQVQQGAAGAAGGFEKLETVLESIAGSTRLSAESLQAIASRLGGIQAVATGASQAIRQVDAEAAALKSTSTTAAAAIDKVSASVAAVGTQAKSTAGDLKALERTNASLGANLQKVGAASAAINQQSRTAAGGLQSLTAAQAAVGAQSKLTGNQVAQLSNQIQDFFVQVQSGGSPLTAFLQQGSQLSAVFGGFGNAFRAVTSLISPMVLALGTAAAAVGALLVAYNQGAAENDAFVRGLVLSGNAAGLTTSRLRALAQAQGEVVGTEGKAAGVLAQLTATGNVTAAVMGKASEAVTRLEREGVSSIEKLVDKFDALGKAPLATLVKLNEAENFLTKAVYDQVRALEQRGKMAEAARVAQEAYADAGITRAKDLEKELGAVERGWRGIVEWAAKGWDAILGVGRKDTLQQQLDKALAALADAPNPARSSNPLLANQRRDAMRQRIEDLRELIRMESQAAQERATQAEGTKAHIAAEDKLAAARKRSAEELQRQIAAGKELAQQMALTEAGFSGSFLEDWKKLEAAHKAGALSADAYAQAHDRLIKQQPVLQAMAKVALDAATAVQAARKAESDGIDAYLRQQKDAAIAAVQSARDRRNALQAEEQAAALAQATNISLASAIETVAIARLQERLQQLDGDSPAAKALRDEIALRREVLTLMGRKEVREANAQAAQDAARAWEQTASTITGLITNAIQIGGKAGWEYVEDYIKANAIQAIVQMGVNGVGNWLGVAGAAANAAGGGGAGGNGWLSLVGTAGQMGGGWTNIASTVGGWVGLGGAASGAGASAAAGSASAASGAASAIPIIGWIIAAIMASKAAYEGGNTLDMLRDAKDDWGAGKFEADKYDTLTALGMSDKWAQILSGAPLTARLFGHKASVSGYGFGTIANGDFVQGTLPMSFGRNVLGGGVDPFMQDLASRIAGGVGVSASLFGGGLTNGLRVGAMTDRDRENEVASLLGFFGADNKLISGVQTGSGAFGAGGPGKDASKIGAADLDKWIGEQLPVLIIQGLQQSNLDDRFDEYFSSISAAKLTPEVANTMLQTATAVQQFTAAFLPLGGVFAQLDDLSVTTVEKLAQASGGFDALGQSVGGYYQAFYDEAERTQHAWDGITKVLQEAGVSTVPKTKTEFRALVDSLADLSTEADQRAFTALMKVSGAFAQLTDAADAAAEATARKAAEEAKARAEQLDDAIAKNLPKFLSPSEQRLLQFQQIQAGLQGAGVSIGLEQLMGASKADVLAFAKAFINLGDGASAAEIAVANAAGALADMADEATQAADDARKTAADQAADRAARQASLNDAFDNLVAGLKQGVSSAYADVQQVIGAERQRAQGEAEKAISALEQQAERITRTYSDLIGSLGDAAKQLSDDLAGDGGRGRALGTLQGALADLRAGRDVDADAVRSAAGTAARLDSAGFGSAFEFRKAQATTANLLREVSAAARQQQTTALGAIAEQQVKVEMELEKQLTKLDDQLKEARSAAGSLANIDSGVQTVAGALARLADSMNAVKAAEGKGGPTGQWVGSDGTQVWASNGGAVAARPAGATLEGTIIRGLKTSFTAADAQAFVQDRLAAGDITGIYWRAVAEGIDSSSLDALMNWAPGTSLAEALKRGLPAFATGSPYVPNTGLALVHQGERIIPAHENAVLMRLLSEGGGAGNGAVVAELRALRAEFEALRRENMDAQHVIANNTGRTARSADDIASGQVTVRTREVAA